jgi:putative hemin transport protein
MHAPAATTLEPRTLFANFKSLKAQKGLRNRDAAAVLGVSEGELIAAGIGEEAIRLKGDFPNFLKRVEAIGDVMALTRNESVVHEKIGTYRKLSHQGHVGLALGEEIDLRIFYSHWRHGFAVTENTPRGAMRSFQFFDADGTAVHKIYLKEKSSLEEYASLLDAWTAEDQAPGIQVSALDAKVAEKPDTEIDLVGFRAAWANMKDTHEFFGLLKKFGVARTQALRLIGSEFAYQVPDTSARLMLEEAARARLEIMCFVGNPGIIQIHTGPVANIKIMDAWLNVLDPGFNLHLRQDRIAQTWVVKKPTTEGIVTSLELFDAEGETIAMFFGKRKPGIPELGGWRDLIARLPGR